MSTKTIAIALTFGLASALPVQAAESSVASQAANTLGQYIAQQGNAALLQIREELKENLADALQPFLPKPEPPPEDPAPDIGTQAY